MLLLSKKKVAHFGFEQRMHSASNEATKPCVYYNTPQGCKFGDNCKFLHQPPSVGAFTRAASQFSHTPSERSTSRFRHLVVHCKKSNYDVYIGRPNPAIQNSDGRWGNPFKIGATMDRAKVIQEYRKWILSKPELVAQVKKELKGKILACWCSPLACHGDVLAEIANDDLGAKKA